MPLPPGVPEGGVLGAPASPREVVPAAALSLRDLEQIALRHNPTLVQAGMALRAAQGRYVQAGLYPNPAVGYAGGDIGLEGTSGQQGMVVGQEIVTGGKLRLGRAAASHEVQQARHGYEVQRRRVMTSVRTGYCEVLLAQMVVDTHEKLMRVAEQGAEVTRRLREAQEVSEAALLRARIEVEQANLGLGEARDQHRILWRQLAAMLGQPYMEPSPLVGDLTQSLPAIDREETLAGLLARSPELARARSGVERARCELALERAMRKPNLETEVWLKYDETAWQTLADVSVGVALPLYDRNQGNIASAQAGLVAAEREVRRLELELHARFAEAFESYANARRQVGAYSTAILPNARASLDLVRQGFQEGEFGHLEVLDAQRTFFNVSLNYLANLRELWIRATELEGLLIQGGLDPVD
jgi:cobalt-zinc-cadmium efflux system outer membrane protein